MANTRVTTNCRLSLGQLNLGRSQVKTGGLGVTVAQVGIDVVAIQEPYLNAGVIRDFGPGVRVVSNGSPAAPPKAAVAVFRSGLTILNLAHLGDSDTVVVCVSTDFGPLYVVSMYCRFGAEFDPYLDRIREILRSLLGCRIVLCLDANAKSCAWGATQSDIRGRALEDLLLESNVHVVNQPGSPATFVSHSGSTFIDVTLATNPGEIRDWFVHVFEDETDHRLISFTWSS